MRLHIWQLKSEASKWSIFATLDLPATMAFQVSLTVKPKGVNKPRPVTTTRRLLKTLPPLKKLAFRTLLIGASSHIINRLLHGTDFFSILIRNFSFKLFF